MARPRKTLTKKQIAEVETLASILSQEQIADYFGMSRVTFDAIKARSPAVSLQYKKGRAKAIAAIGTGLINKARGGDLGAMCFYLKTQAGWTEKQEEENTGDTLADSISKLIDKLPS